MEYPDIDHPDESDLVDTAKSAIDHTGTICDGCNTSLDEDDVVYLWGDWHDGMWQFRRTSCADCGDQLDERPLVEAIVKCRVGEAIDKYGEFRKLVPLDVVQLNTSDGAVIRKE